MKFEPLTTVEEVAAHTGEPIETDADRLLCESMIRAASANVRFHGLPWATMEEAPDIARTIACTAAARGFMNPSGFMDERSDSVTLKRSEMYANDTKLTPEEVDMLKELKGQSTVRSVALDLGSDYFNPRSQAHGFVRRNLDECVPIVYPPGTPFPLYRVGRVRRSLRR